MLQKYKTETMQAALAYMEWEIHNSTTKNLNCAWCTSPDYMDQLIIQGAVQFGVVGGYNMFILPGMTGS
jgi:hypothetical protein